MTINELIENTIELHDAKVNYLNSLKNPCISTESVLHAEIEGIRCVLRMYYSESKGEYFRVDKNGYAIRT